MNFRLALFWLMPWNNSPGGCQRL